MSAITVQEILDQVSYMLTDDANTRWTAAKLLDWFNEAQREVVVKRPDAYSSREPLITVAGSTQSLPAEGLRLLDVIGLSKIDEHLLDMFLAGWRSGTEVAASALEHFITDERIPTTFDLYPPSIAGESINILISKLPEVQVDASQLIDVNDSYANALQEYILHRAWSKDAEYAGNDQRSQLHLGNFQRMIGEKTQSDTTAAAKK
jgi:hypothetical protein